MPQALVDKIQASSTFNQGYATVSYLSSAIVDMDLHTQTTPPTDIDAFEKASLARIGMPREIVMRHRLPQFNHLFTSDAYSAGYYSYLWSETMDADTWAYFEVGRRLQSGHRGPVQVDHAGAGQHYRPGRGLPRLPRSRPGRGGPAEGQRLPGFLILACRPSAKLD